MGLTGIADNNIIPCPVVGVTIKLLGVHKDGRGRTVELFRNDDESPINLSMGYASITNPGVSRGPHKHKFQTDNFAFIEGMVYLKLWNNGCSIPYTIILGLDRPALVTIEPGVIHGYTNMGILPVIIMNFPDRLYKGEDKQCDVDEVRYENNPESLYKM
jgi:dTDP-4-dehydrorhamnose 3,5-epimerase